jgi:GDPmannose 4,6-dehydratase
MRSALITGISGQDGSYMAQLLLPHGYRVIGASRDVVRAAAALPLALQGTVELVPWDMSDEAAMEGVLREHQVTEFYNFAGYTSGAGMYDDPVGIGDANGLAVVRMLEAIRAVDPGIRFCQASSREVFGEALESPQSETTARAPRSPYGAAKAYADAMVRIYRELHGLFACSAILFNHESPRRGLGFVTRKITHAAAAIKLKQADELLLGNLDAQRDWGFAGDSVRAMWLMLQANAPQDYVIATGTTHSVRDFCDCAFGLLGLDYRRFVKQDKSAYRLAEKMMLVGDPGKANRQLGWTPQVGFEQLVGSMVDADLRLLSGNDPESSKASDVQEN